MIIDTTPRPVRIRRTVTDATQIEAWDETATDEDLREERRLIQHTKLQLHRRDQQIVAILAERGRNRREAS